MSFVCFIFSSRKKKKKISPNSPKQTQTHNSFFTVTEKKKTSLEKYLLQEPT